MKRCITKDVFRICYLFVSVLSLCLFQSCQKNQSPDVTILISGRMNGNVYPLELHEISPLQHYPYLSGYVKQVRAEAESQGTQVLLFDSGDSLGGSFAAHATQSENMATFFNHLKYDALFLGNLDANLSGSQLKKIESPVLTPFMNRDQVAIPNGMKPVHYLQKEGMKIMLAANFYGTIPSSEYPQRFPLWFGKYNQPVLPIRDYQKWLKPDLAADLHLRHWMKFTGEPQPSAGETDLLDSIHADIVMAHKVYQGKARTTWQHRNYSKWPVPVVENILRVNKGFSLARIDLKKTPTGWFATSAPRLVQMTANTAPADETLLAELSPLANRIKQADQQLGQIGVELSKAELLAGYMNTLTRIEGTNAIVCSLNSIRDTIEPGPLSASRLFNAIPWTTDLEILTMTREQFAKVEDLSGSAF